MKTIADELTSYFDLEDNKYLEVYLSKDRLFTIREEVDLGKFGLFSESNNHSIPEVNQYWTLPNRNFRDTTIKECLKQYLRIKIASYEM